MEKEEGREWNWGYLCKMRKDLLKTLDKKISEKKVIGKGERFSEQEEQAPRVNPSCLGEVTAGILQREGKKSKSGKCRGLVP